MGGAVGGEQRKLVKHNSHLLYWVMGAVKFSSQSCVYLWFKIYFQVGGRLLRSPYVSNFWLTCEFVFCFPCFEVPLMVLIPQYCIKMISLSVSGCALSGSWILAQWKTGKTVRNEGWGKKCIQQVSWVWVGEYAFRGICTAWDLSICLCSEFQMWGNLSIWSHSSRWQTRMDTWHETGPPVGCFVLCDLYTTPKGSWVLSQDLCTKA